MNIKNIADIVKLCYENYDEKTMKHALRVAEYALDNILSSSLLHDEIYVTALCHDLIEDTKISLENIDDILKNDNVKRALSILTKPHNENYTNYIRNIKASNNKLAYCIKLADMKDHLSQSETLTDKLKEKYWNVLPYLL